MSSFRDIGNVRRVETRSVSQVVGANARAIRQEAGATLDEVARVARRYGLKWTVARVAELEKGKLPVALGQLFVIAHTLSEVSKSRTTLPALLESDGFVELTPEFAVRSTGLQRMLAGEPAEFTVGEMRDGPERLTQSTMGSVRTAGRIIGLDGDVWQETMRTAGIADSRSASRLDLDLTTFLSHAAQIWGTSLTGERDRRLPEDAPPQARGQVTRALERELREQVAAGE